MDIGSERTRGDDYAERLVRLQTARWKQRLDVQAPFRWNLRRLHPGFTLDLGCGIGRNLLHLRGNGIGVDTNPHCVAAARARGLRAYTPEEFRSSADDNYRGRFDSLLLAHVAEHMTEDEAVALLGAYADVVKPGGQLILITPQEAGFKSDSTHVQLMDFDSLRRISRRAGFEPYRAFSFPFPRWAGALFKYNEFVVVGRAEA